MLPLWPRSYHGGALRNPLHRKVHCGLHGRPGLLAQLGVKCPGGVEGVGQRARIRPAHLDAARVRPVTGDKVPVQSRARNLVGISHAEIVLSPGTSILFETSATLSLAAPHQLCSWGAWPTTHRAGLSRLLFEGARPDVLLPVLEQARLAVPAGELGHLGAVGADLALDRSELRVLVVMLARPGACFVGPGLVEAARRSEFRGLAH